MKGLFGLKSLITSNDSENVYVTFGRSNTILSFTLDQESDSLIFLQKYEFEKKEKNYYDELNLIRIDPSDNYVYTTSLVDAELSLFQRDTITGILDPIDVFNEDDDGFEGLDMISDLDFDQSGADIYITSWSENAISNLKMGPFLGKDRHLCEGDISRLALPYTYDKYLWSTGDTTSQIEIDEEGEYWVQVIDPYGIVDHDTIEIFYHNIKKIDLGSDTVLCFSDSIRLSIDDHFSSYLWNTGETTSYIDALEEGEYSVCVRNEYNCETKDTILVEFASPSELLLDENIFLCRGDTISILPYGSYQSYLWNGNVTTAFYQCYIPGQIVLQVVDEDNCSILDSSFVTYAPNPNLSDDLFVSAGEEISLFANGGPFDYIIWQDSIEDYPLVLNPSLYSADQLIISARMKNEYGCYNHDSIKISIDYNNIDASSIINIVYPNPVRDVLTIQFNQFVDLIGIEIFDSTGKKIAQFKETNTPNISLDINSLKPGLYFFEINIRDNSWMYKIVVAK